MKVEYSSNNSGGRWWLKDEDWIALEKAGWTVAWGGTCFCPKKGKLPRPGDRKPTYKIKCVPKQNLHEKEHGLPASCKGHSLALKYEDLTDDLRFLGAPANNALFECETPGDAMRFFEEVTGQDVTDEGCNCCGCPHHFSWEGGYASGEECLQYLHPGKKIPKNLREAIEGS